MDDEISIEKLEQRGREILFALKTEKENLAQSLLNINAEDCDLELKMRRQAHALNNIFAHLVREAQDCQHNYVYAFRAQQQFCKTLEILNDVERLKVLKRKVKTAKTSKKRKLKREERNE